MSPAGNSVPSASLSSTSVEDFIHGDPSLFGIQLEFTAPNVTEDDVVDERTGGGLTTLGEP